MIKDKVSFFIFLWFLFISAVLVVCFLDKLHVSSFMLGLYCAWGLMFLAMSLIGHTEQQSSLPKQ